MIFYFSGTGNTRHVAEMLSRRIGSDVRSFTADELRNPSDTELSSADKVIVWAFPTYSWGVPPVVRHIIEEGKLNFAPDAVHIAVTTCGDDVGNLPKMFRHDIESRGMKGGAVYSVAMPNTYVMMKGFDTDSDKIARAKIEASIGAVERIARAIQNGKISSADDMVVPGKFACVKTSVIYPWFCKFDMNPKGFSVDAEKCIECSKCGHACPMRNIEYDAAGHPLWGDKCAFCTACYHVCPVHAIDWKGKCRSKGQVRYFRN